MIGTLFAPGKYIQGNGLLNQLQGYTCALGNKVAVITDEIVMKIIGEKIKQSYANSDDDAVFLLFQGESTMNEAKRLAQLVKEEGCKVIVGAGGGKVIDSSKLVGYLTDLPIVIIPTTAASDAPCSHMSVIYDENGSFVESKQMKRNPDVVLVDTGVIANAPSRTLIAGIGDAFATYYEARACKASKTPNYTGGVATCAAYALAELCNSILREYGVEARKAVDNKVVNEALEKVVEANIYLSGVGFENNGCAVSHATYNGLTHAVPHLKALHGEVVAFGTILQLILEKTPQQELDAIVDFYKNVGMPLALKDLGIENTSPELLEKIAVAIVKEGKHTSHMPFEVTSDMVLDALKKTEQWI